MSTYQLDFIGGDQVSQRTIDERNSKYAELAAFMNAEPNEIGKFSALTTQHYTACPIHYLTIECSLRTLDQWPYS